MIEDMQIRNLSPSTIECYSYHVGRFAKYFNVSSTDTFRGGPRMSTFL